MSNTALHTDKAPAAIGPYSQGIQAGNTIYVSGQIPIDPATGEFAGQDIKTQTRQSLTNISNILAAAGPGRAGPVRRGEDHCVSQGHERFRRHERGVR